MARSLARRLPALLPALVTLALATACQPEEDPRADLPSPEPTLGVSDQALNGTVIFPPDHGCTAAQRDRIDAPAAEQGPGKVAKTRRQPSAVSRQCSAPQIACSR